MSEMQKNESIADVFMLGLKTWLAEIKWLGKSALGRYEISRLEKELNREYGILGRIAESPKGKKSDKELCLNQIVFLKEEIETLKKDIAGNRKERMKDLHKQNGK
jgi:hypothetical protein